MTLNHSIKANAVGILRMENEVSSVKNGGIGVDVVDGLLHGEFSYFANGGVEGEDSSDIDDGGCWCWC